MASKYRFGQEVRRLSPYMRLLAGHDYSGLHDREKQVLIKDQRYSLRNADHFYRERMVLKLLNQRGQAQGRSKLCILPYFGWDDAIDIDTYFVVTKRLFGDRVLDRLAAGKMTAKRLLLCIHRM